MKKFAILLAVSSTFLFSCGTERLSTSTDDVYVNPAEEQKKQKLIAEERARQEALAQQKAEQARAAEKARIDSNKYYKDPQYNYEDYYDYEYASRLNRFTNPIGVGYYDNYYTNMYTYNQNPAYYGTSIYSSLNYGMPVGPSTSFGFGVSTGYGYNNGYYPGYGNHSYYDPFYNSGYGCACGSGYYGGYGAGYYGGYGYPSNTYMMGYNAGFYSGSMYSSWPYYNSYDVNSAYSKVNVGPRQSNVGSNTSGRTGGETAVRESQGSQQRYLESVSQQQSSSPRFMTIDQQERVRNYENSGTRIDGAREVISMPSGVNQGTRDSDRNRGNDKVMQRPAEPQRNDNTYRREEQQNTSPGRSEPSPRNSGGGATRPR
ncbi:MAG: hypothetical protein PSX36_11305 [bacterium]|nr:hypothetical protein [bacterium]